MLPETTLATVFLMGLLGSTHCAAMCGGIACALSMNLAPQVRRSHSRVALFLLCYNAGRIASYAVAGAIAGLIGAGVLSVLPPHVLRSTGFFVSAIILFALGLRLAGLRDLFAGLERAGATVWRRIEPFGRRLLPVSGPGAAFAMGMVWGWLPCGLVYSALALAAISASPAHGSLAMLLFGLGTLPMLLAVGAAGRWLGAVSRQPAVRGTAAAVVICLGAAAFYAGLVHAHGERDGDHATHSAVPARAS